MTERAKPGTDGDRPRRAAPPPPPKWRRGLPLIGIIATLLLLFWPVRTTNPTELNYSQFLSRVRAGQVATATIDADGGVSGTLKGGDDYTTQIPTALQDTSLAQELQNNGVQITGEGPGGTSFFDILLTFLPFLLLIGVYVWIGRRAQRQVAGGIGGGIGARANAYP